MTKLDNIQDGYKKAPARSAGHEVHKFEMYRGWKECQRLGIPYVPEPIEHSNVYIRTAMATEDEVIIKYFREEDRLANDLSNPVAVVHHPRVKVTAVKYSYPVEMTPAERKRLRAELRRRNR